MSDNKHATELVVAVSDAIKGQIDVLKDDKTYYREKYEEYRSKYHEDKRLTDMLRENERQLKEDLDALTISNKKSEECSTQLYEENQKLKKELAVLKPVHAEALKKELNDTQAMMQQMKTNFLNDARNFQMFTNRLEHFRVDVARKRGRDDAVYKQYKNNKDKKTGINRLDVKYAEDVLTSLKNDVEELLDEDMVEVKTEDGTPVAKRHKGRVGM